MTADTSVHVAAAAVPAARVSGVRLPPDPRSAATARLVVLQACVGLPACEEVVFVGQLLTSELVTNAVLHARSTITLSVLVADDVLRVEVGDTGPGTPVERASAPADERGRGISIVQQAADRWGVVPGLTSGKTVWFELALDDGRPR